MADLFGMEGERSQCGRFTLRELLAEAEREIQMRRNVYGRQVRAGKMTQADADRGIELMTEIRRRLSLTAGMQ